MAMPILPTSPMPVVAELLLCLISVVVLLQVQLTVSGMLANGFNTGTPGFKENLTQGTLLKPGQIRKSATPGLTFSTFTLGATDLGNLVRLGNASRAAKGADMLTYQSNVVRFNAVDNNVNQFTTN